MRLPTTTTTTIHKQRERPRQRERIPKEGHTSRQTLKKRTTYRKNRHRQKHIQNANTAYTINNNNNIEPQLETNQNNDDALVILAKHTTLTEAQKCVLKKGLTFIPKPKQLPIQALHTDIRNFMHRLETIFEL